MLTKSVKVLLAWAAGVMLGGCAGAAPCGAPGRLCAPEAPITSMAAPPQADAAPGAVAPDGAVAPVRIGLLLPLGAGGTLAAAAAAVRAGFLAAYRREPDGLALAVIESGESAQETLAAYVRAQEWQDIIVGPLARPAVTALAASALVRKPTIALNRPDARAAPPPAQLLVIGLSLEDEARQAADWAAAEHPDGAALVLTAGAPWQRRAGLAFLEHWQRLGRAARTVELSALDGYLSEGELARLREQTRDEAPALLFGALDAGQARQLRAALGGEIALYGTSSLNSGRTPAAPELDGVRLLDLPWQLQPDHPAVMAYPAPAAPAATADMARLYALGIDAFRIARALALRPAGSFSLDGVTGQLSVSFGQGPARFARIEQPAVYRDGAPAPLAAPSGPAP